MDALAYVSILIDLFRFAVIALSYKYKKFVDMAGPMCMIAASFFRVILKHIQLENLSFMTPEEQAIYVFTISLSFTDRIMIGFAFRKWTQAGLCFLITGAS